MKSLTLLAVAALSMGTAYDLCAQKKDVLRIRENLENPTYNVVDLDLPAVQMINFESNQLQGFKPYDEQQKFVPCQGDGGCFSVTIPENWTKHTEKNGAKLVINAPKDDANDSFREYGYIVKHKVDTQNGLDCYSVSLMNKFRKKYQNVQILDEGELTINGVDSKWAVVSFADKNGKEKAIVFAFFKNNVGYAGIFRAEEAKFDKYRPIYEKIAKSIRIK